MRNDMNDVKLEYIELLKEAPMKLQIQALNACSIHWHNEYEVLFVLRGSLSVTCEQGKFLLNPGDLLMIDSQEVHSTDRITQDNLCLVLQFSPSVISEVYQSSFQFSLNTTKENQALSPDVFQAFQKVLSGMCLALYDKPDGYQFKIKSGLYLFISMLFSYVQYRIVPQAASLQSNDHLEDLDRIKAYIKENYRQEIRAEDLARILGISRSKLYQILKLAGAGSIKKLTNYYRVLHAKQLLKQTDSSIPYIATDSGFDSESSFFRVFKNQTGMSPNEFRNAPTLKTEKTGVQGYERYATSDAIALLEQFYSGTHPSNKCLNDEKA